MSDCFHHATPGSIVSLVIKKREKKKAGYYERSSPKQTLTESPARLSPAAPNVVYREQCVWNGVEVSLFACSDLQVVLYGKISSRENAIQKSCIIFLGRSDAKKTASFQ